MEKQTWNEKEYLLAGHLLLKLHDQDRRRWYYVDVAGLYIVAYVQHMRT